MSCAKGCCDSQREHWMSIGISSTVTPSRRGAAKVADTERFEAKIDKNRSAYKRLRDDGLQPAHLMDAYAVERDARTEMEVTTGNKFKDLSMAADADAMSKELFH